jgi:hypothetical protein
MSDRSVWGYGAPRRALSTHDSALRTQHSGLSTQDSALRTQHSALRTLSYRSMNSRSVNR